MIYPHAETERKQFGERFALSQERIQEIFQEMAIKKEGLSEEFRDYFRKTADFILLTNRTLSTIESGAYYQFTLEKMQQINQELYQDILPENYESSYANPSYAVKKLGKDYGPLLCLLYTEIRGNIAYTFERRLFYLTVTQELFIEIFNLLEEADCTPDEIRNAFYYYISDYADITLEDRTRALLLPEDSFALSVISEADFNDPRFLYFTGEYISENEIGTAACLNSFSQEEIDHMAATFTSGFQKGFELYQIDLSQKNTVNIRYHVGFERMIRAAVEQFKAMGLNTAIYRAGVSLIHKNSRGIKVGFCSTSANPQYDYDHRFDEALILDKALADRKLSQQRHVYETYRTKAAGLAGPAVIEVFGEKPFVPVTKKEAASYQKKQQQIRLEYQSASSLLSNEFIPGDQVSFTIISYPVPEIGNQYREIFDATVQVNTLPTEEYLKIQTTIINALDQGEYVHITGRNGNHTDLTVALSKLEQPDKQTNFENCLADVNIPLGEVFTSPKLEGTHGTLHVTEVYLNDLKYKELSLTIQNGTIADYTCKNFSEEADNKKYIEENILFHHKTLPMGEFAIGTNTTAYAMGKKYHISHLLPILIAEKTGPHFAFGDTCFSHEEDLKTYNPDGKQMMAKENTFSALRKTEPEKAYFNCHTDITIPYNELGDITVCCHDQTTIDILKQGRFVLSGTEALNKPL